jgi:hypothetical protein
MYRVQYFCPRQAPYWQDAGYSTTYEAAMVRAQVVRPPTPNGRVRIFNPLGQVIIEF